MYNCKKCGNCCRNLKKSEIYKKLDRGDGTCVFLENNLCSIYEKRPLICQIDKFYELYLSDKLDISEYYKLNNLACEEMK